MTDTDQTGRVSRWRTFGTPRCPRTFPEIPYVEQHGSTSGDGCDCWDCMEIRTERERDRFKADLATRTRERDEALAELDRLKTPTV